MLVRSKAEGVTSVCEEFHGAMVARMRWAALWTSLVAQTRSLHVNTYTVRDLTKCLMILEKHGMCWCDRHDTDLTEDLHFLNQQLKSRQASPTCPKQCQTPMVR